MPGQPLAGFPNVFPVSFPHLIFFFLSLFRMEAGARIRTPAYIRAAVPEDSQAATASITHHFTATPVHANKQVTNAIEYTTSVNVCDFVVLQRPVDQMLLA